MMKAPATVATDKIEGIAQRPPGEPWDAAFCDAVLGQVSRTFALSIQGLPAALAPPVQIAYLLCRVVDSIEDDDGLVLESRVALFDAFDATVAGTSKADALESKAIELGLGSSVAERALCANAGRVFRCFRRLPAEQQQALAPHVLEMSRGMRHFASRKDAEGRLWLEDLPELSQYCHFVAGTVGLMLTKLFEQDAAVLAASTRDQLRRQSEPFGQALQLVNILKDVVDDYTKGRCFLPRSLARRHGLQLDSLLCSTQRTSAMGVVAELVAVCRGHLKAARQYTLLWPAVGSRHVRVFCAVPLGLAYATLRVIERGHDTLKAGRLPSVGREFVAALVADVAAAAGSDAALGLVLERCEHG